MFDFFVKKSEVVLDCFTYNHSAFENAPIDSAYAYVPEWWKKTPGIHEETGQATIKNCVAFMDFYKQGITIPAWFELKILIRKNNDPDNIDYEWRASNDDFTANQTHDEVQFINFSKGNGKNFKIDSPWMFKEKTGINFVWSQPTWSMRNILEKITVLPGVMNFKHQFSTNINFLVCKKEENQLIEISPLTPLVVLHPMTEKNVKIVNHLISKEEWHKKIGVIENMMIRDMSALDLIKRYSKKVKLHNKIEEIRSCPFHRNIK